MRHFCKSGLCFLLGALLWLAPQVAAAQVQLRYRYQPNESLYYELKQTLTMVADIAGQSLENQISQQLQLGTRIHEVHPDGSATVSKRIYRIQMKATQPSLEAPLEYDSQSQEELPEQFRLVADSLSKLVNQDIQMVLSPLGETSAVQLPRELEEQLKKNKGGLTGADSIEGIKSMISQGSVIFPEKAVSVNDQWTRELSTDLPFGTMKSTVVLTYAGQTPEGLHRINAATRISMIPKEGIPFQVAVKEADGRGVYLFDANRGRIYASALKQTLDLELSAAGQTMKQHVVTDVTMRLIEPTVTR